jgi:hypothetical protein
MDTGISAFSPALQKMEEEFEQTRSLMQAARVKLLFASRQARHSARHDRNGYAVVRANTCESAFWTHDVQKPAI